MKTIRINKLIIVIILFVSFIFGCNTKKENSVELVTDTKAQESIFKNLIDLTYGALPEPILQDSLAFLVLPVQASCPACRKKTIDSIVKHSKNLADRHFIIISANGGRKTINGFFMEIDKKLPVIENRLFLDTVNMALKYNLYDQKPTIYYTFNKKVYKKVGAIPATVKDDLQEFFSGFRKDENLAIK